MSSGNSSMMSSDKHHGDGMGTGRLYVVGIGPGYEEHMTFRAKQCIEESSIVIGYETYIDLIRHMLDGKQVYAYAMTQEVDRANHAIELASKGNTVSLVSSGDPGIYGMAGLVYEVLAERNWDGRNPYVEVVPGVSSLNACAALVGSPLMTDFAVVSMSDLLVPWDIIVKRVEAAAQGDFVIVIYNPQSKKRVHQLRDTRDILLKYRSANTPVAIVKAAYRDSQSIVLTDLEHMLEHQEHLGMLTTIIVGNSSTFTYRGLMINPRGYKSKYELVREQV
ncbi:MAG: precorrin-3B C(17)-methyltransferase [Candidatus Nitrosocaldus sp.]|nr:precorrin-3B C(17)-methyltransferase [Candidatus Nitrosocaldus sp.]MDW8000709.1 precorrin-3B C(17)-methyltransferase [Candidatus Nitrosocaldus sp.]